MKNQDHILDILNLLKNNFENSEDMAALFITGDMNSETALVDCKGNMEVLAQAFGNMMNDRPQFNQLMKALIGSYLSHHPEEKADFIKGLEIANLNPSDN